MVREQEERLLGKGTGRAKVQRARGEERDTNLGMQEELRLAGTQ
jgi:hypothetical protein